MAKDLTNSKVDRLSLLNNEAVINEFEGNFKLPNTLVYEGEAKFTLEFMALFYEVSTKSISRIVEANRDELSVNGYQVHSGDSLKIIKGLASEYEKNMDIAPRARQIGLFNFKALLNIGMLLTDSDQAKRVRSMLLDFALNAINKRLGGHTKYVSQRDVAFIENALEEAGSHMEFTLALAEKIDWKDKEFSDALFVDKIYAAIFLEHDAEYRQLLSLDPEENSKATMYAEVLSLIASLKNGYISAVKKHFKKHGKLLYAQALSIMDDYIEAIGPTMINQYSKARATMASCDSAFRDIDHQNLSAYKQAVTSSEIEKYLGEKGKEVEKLIQRNIEIFERLKLR